MVSIISIFYNSEPFIERCVESLAKQTSKDFEVLFINDGSTDRSLEVLQKALKNTDINTRILNHEVNYGISVARNTGVDAASGDIVSFVDSDDFVSPDYVQKIINAFEDSPAELLIFGLNKYNTSLGKGDDHIFGPKEEILSLDIYAEQVGYNLPGYYYVQMAFRRNVMNKNRLRFFPGCSPGEDVEFMLKYICFVEKIQVIPDILYTYIIHGSNVTSGNPLRFNYHYWGITERLHNWMEGHDNLSPARLEMLNMGIAKHYKKLFSNSWKYRIREFQTGNRRVKSCITRALKYPYLEKPVKFLLWSLITVPWAVQAAYRIKMAVKKR